MKEFPQTRRRSSLSEIGLHLPRLPLCVASLASVHITTGFGSIASPLYHLTEKGGTFVWMEESDVPL